MYKGNFTYNDVWLMPVFRKMYYFNKLSEILEEEQKELEKIKK